MDIEYDLLKAEANFRKHGISFDEAITALHDSRALVIEDPDVEGEYRWVVTGISEKVRLLTVVYTLRDNDVLRIISARRATRAESFYY